jgi:hypothetical protein
MTFSGRIVPVNRFGMSKNETGVLAKSSFEETSKIMFNAATWAEKDSMRGVSANIMFGQKPPCGTGFVDILIDETRLPEGVEEEMPVEEEILELVLGETTVLKKYGLTETHYELVRRSDVSLKLVLDEKGLSERQLRALVKAAFAQRRKTLRNNLKEIPRNKHLKCWNFCSDIFVEHVKHWWQNTFGRRQNISLNKIQNLLLKCCPVKYQLRVPDIWRYSCSWSWESGRVVG